MSNNGKFQRYITIDLGISAMIGASIDGFEQRISRRLRLIHSGQKKLDQLVEHTFRESGSLKVMDGNFVYVLPVPDIPQVDMFGYQPSKIAGAGDCAISEGHSRSATGALEDPSRRSDDEVGGLSAPSSDASSAATASNEAGLTASTDPASEGLSRRSAGKCASNPGRADTQHDVQVKPMAGKAVNHVQKKDDWQQERQNVAQVLSCVQNSSSNLTQVREILATSDDVLRDIRRLEADTGLTSGPAREFIKSKQGKFDVEVDGDRVLFNAAAVRPEVIHQNTTSIRVVLRSVSKTSDVMPVSVLQAQGDVPLSGLRGLKAHQVRFVELNDFQRGVLAVLRAANERIDLVVKEIFDTMDLVAKPALVVDPGDWNELALRAAACLQLFCSDAKFETKVASNDEETERRLA